MVLEAALDRALDRGADHLVVDLTGVTFCGARGLALLVRSGVIAAGRGTGYSVRAVPRHRPDLGADLACEPTIGPAHRGGRRTDSGGRPDSGQRPGRPAIVVGRPAEAEPA